MKKGNWCDDCMDLNHQPGDVIGEMPLPHFVNCGECKAGSHWLPKEKSGNFRNAVLADVLADLNKLLDIEWYEEFEGKIRDLIEKYSKYVT